MRTLARLATGLVAVPLLLAGCAVPGLSGGSSAPAASAPATTAPAGGSTQTKAEACDALSATMSTASDTLNSAVSEMGTDPAKAVAALKDFAGSLEGAIAAVNNPEVKAQGEKAVAAVKALVDALNATIQDPTKAADMAGSLSAFQTEMTAFATLCQG